MALDKMYDIKYVAELCGVSSKTIQRLIKRGDLDSVMVGFSRRIPTTSLNNFYKLLNKRARYLSALPKHNIGDV